ncbi:hypothetical protein [Acidovorax sp. Leaf160]|uniref:hypothetical protein n=1 Tax=Acidovorax sp. Leaf160 TaxID=1736280 RepID=UPI0006FC21BE|nr:hypothetical protein [Acidovorax sp. Leaf160]KQR55620.1 hypothetical protein ASF94_04230 [Acidovorax sp. Leaf160]
MNANEATTPITTAPVDPDLAQQAHPGHGVPSQDPTLAAQDPLTPAEARRESQSVLMGGGVMAGAATGAALGVAAAGPVGVVVGGITGGIAGALGGAAIGTATQADATGANANLPMAEEGGEPKPRG